MSFIGDFLSSVEAKVRANPKKAALVAAAGAVGVLALPAGAVVGAAAAIGSAVLAIPSLVGAVVVAHPAVVGGAAVVGAVVAAKKLKKDDKDKKDEDASK